VVIRLSFCTIHRAQIIPLNFEIAKLTGTAAMLYNISRAFRSRGPSRAIRFVHRGNDHSAATPKSLFQRDQSAIVTIN
jgi:hypothetical protein